MFTCFYLGYTTLNIMAFSPITLGITLKNKTLSEKTLARLSIKTLARLSINTLARQIKCDTQQYCYAEYRFKYFMRSVVMLGVTNSPFMLRIVMLSV